MKVGRIEKLVVLAGKTVKIERIEEARGGEVATEIDAI